MRSAICVSDRRSSLRYFFRMGTVARSIRTQFLILHNNTIAFALIMAK